MPRSHPALPAVLAVLLLAAACSGGGSKSSNSGLSGSSSDWGTAKAIPRVAFYYQPINAKTDLSRLGAVDLVITVDQRDEAAAAKAIHAIGARAFRYVQSYWFPAGADV